MRAVRIRTGAQQWSRVRSILVPLLAALVLLLAVLAVAGEWEGIVAALNRAQPAWLVSAVGMSGVIFPLWSWQWQLLTGKSPAPGRQALLRVVSANSIVSSFLAPGAGAALAAVMLSESRMRAPSIASLLLVDQMITGAVKLLVLVLAMLLAPLPPALAAAGPMVAATFACLLAFVVALLRVSPWLQSQTGATWPLWAWLPGCLGALSRALAAIGDGKTMALIAGLAVGKKGLEWAMITAVQLACGMGWEPGLALVVLAAAGVSTMLPVVGGVGLLAAGTAGAYLLMGIAAPTAIAVGILVSIVDLPAAIAYFCWGQLTQLDHRKPQP